MIDIDSDSFLAWALRPEKLARRTRRARKAQARARVYR